MNPKVIISTSLTPNILMHIFSCFEIDGSFYNSDYGMKHHFTILDEEYKIWEEVTKKCLTLNCDTELYAILFQIPSYIPAEDIEMIIDNYNNIIEAVNEGSMESLIDNYPGVFDNLSIYAPMSMLDNHFKNLFEYKESVIKIIEEFKTIIEGTWERFYKEYWEKECRLKLNNYIKDLDQILSPTNIISAWQKKLHLNFPYSEFVAFVVEPTTTIATDLLAEKIMITFKREDIEQYKIIIHEVGRSFLLNAYIFEYDKLKPIAQSNIEKLSLIIDAALIHLKKSLQQIFHLKSFDPDPYAIPEVNQIVPIFAHVWDKIEEKNIFEAIIQTYNKIAPII